MSDFTSNFWSIFVSAISILGIVYCAFLLWFSAKVKVSAHEEDGTTGHVWDEDLREMNNPLPRWWLWLFIITMVFAAVYFIAYPGLGSFGGKLGWTSQNQYEAEVAKANKDLEPLYAAFNAQTPEQLSQDPKAMAVGERLFMNNCAQCHGSDARGSKGFPNLTDKDWLHGGTPDKIKETLTKGRIGQMPPMAAAVGTPDDVRNVSHYVLSLSGSPHDSVRAALGKGKFGACAACHGPDGAGMQAVGSANLTDKIWLHGWGEAAITAMINNGKINQMPAQEGRLTTSQIHVLTAYVWGFSNKPTVTK
ncbi:cytochrome-c oxidase, cbb3-type subunit III [Limnohabitans sp. Jir61]|uniref:cytochrome-c oxidase, cbb3-type subunit III n=1 Tax=Limnohabitans sp. Jir61 TaxID=1826168 RepID=UPI000D34C19A|nr:cytochrome-c oxidase, cbb3-type subunit III [Limnohabitans sp. Jir61]PUE32574.1 cytochrome-c oxidase, cbb3-type subunit III [Limnohabitans sp. Jir61]